MDKHFIVNAVGDVWFGDHPVAIGRGVMSSAQVHGPEFFFNGVKHLFAEGDINFCNLESVLSNSKLNKWYLPSIEMRGFPDCVLGLKSAGFNVVNVANNHMHQHGIEAFLETLSILESNHILSIGVDKDGSSNRIFFKKGDLDICLVGYSLHPEEYFSGEILYSYRDNTETILSEIQKLKSSFDGFVICSLHWGKEYIHYPSRAQVLFARKLVDAGVKIILGHHPHVLQSIEEYNNGLIAYSLGNFLFDLWPERTKESVVLKIRIGDKDKFDYTLSPICINDKYQPVMAEGEAKCRIEKNIAIYNAMIYSVSLVKADNDYLADLQKIENTIRLGSYKYFIKNILKTPPMLALQSIIRTLYRKLFNK